ncbi:hypothetical protein LPB72_19665 [Hydrogenophaga crassostreae]|uniref:Uncharacterized protein n=1 Tax=Hydrogenophaga crassostreae TaxID=1763535 RepID=A0A167GRF8_9BURK|nr:hypothetical protein [Hydrogenophaga crassostreae]AOW11709.1 hypothetical protein LPB072_01400 [Hydrogenophaga crassostreae]OAD39801.1 hypothetical protein LPB72_19665 [Hydrogenophaga crassostreae]
MSTILNSFSRTASVRNAAQANGDTSMGSAPSRIGVRSLTVMLLAAAVSALVVFADQYVGVWTDGHLFFGWVILWAVVFAGLALFAGTARNLAARTMNLLDRWSQSMAHARAEARLWDIAKSDPRVMSELMVARMRDQDAKLDTDFEAALAPMGFETPVATEATTGWGRFPERLAASRAHRMHLYYI